MSGKPRHDEESVAHCWCRGAKRRDDCARHSDVRPQWRTAGADTSGNWHRRRIDLGKHFHVRENRTEPPGELIGASRIDTESRQLSDAENIFTGDRHYSCPRSRVVYASLMIFLPTFSSSKSITAFTS